MDLFACYHADEKMTQELESLFPGLMFLPMQARGLATDALYTSLRNSAFASFQDIPFSERSHHYPLYRHINEVVEIGMQYFEYASSHWQDQWTAQIDRTELIELLLLHDVDKPMILGDSDKAAVRRKYVQHGVLGGLVLQRLGLPDRVASLVTTHSPSSGLHTADPMAAILHYADMFSCDHIYMLVDRKPNYCL